MPPRAPTAPAINKRLKVLQVRLPPPARQQRVRLDGDALALRERLVQRERGLRDQQVVACTVYELGEGAALYVSLPVRRSRCLRRGAWAADYAIHARQATRGAHPGSAAP